MTSVLYEKKQLQQLRTKRTAQKNASAPEQEGKTSELLAKELGVAKFTVTRAITDLWGDEDSAELTADDLAMIVRATDGVAKGMSVQVRKLAHGISAKLQEKIAILKQTKGGGNNVLRHKKCAATDNFKAPAPQRTQDAMQKMHRVAENATPLDDFKISAPQKVLLNGKWSYVITEKQEALIRCLLVPNRKELAQYIARLHTMLELWQQAAAEAQLSSDRFEFALDLREQPALRDDASRVAELERQVAELRGQNTELKSKVVAKHEALLRMEGERNAYKDLYMGVSK